MNICGLARGGGTTTLCPLIPIEYMYVSDCIIVPLKQIWDPPLFIETLEEERFGISAVDVEVVLRITSIVSLEPEWL